jgi:hypothetical protein
MEEHHTKRHPRMYGEDYELGDAQDTSLDLLNSQIANL